jgi:type I restriction enzyme S subunit
MALRRLCKPFWWSWDMSEWKVVALGSITTQRKGINYKSEDYSDAHSGHPFITIKCFVKGGGYEPTGIKFYDGFSTKADYLSAGDILFSVTDLTRAGDIVGSPLRVPDFGGEKLALASMDCMWIQPIAGRCDKAFLYHRLMLADVRRRMVAYSAGSTVLHLDTKKVPTISVRVPVEIRIQRKIASILNGIDLAIEKTEALVAKYQQIKAGLIHDLFTRGVLANGQLRPSYEQEPELYHETAIGWIPREWQVVRMVSLAEDRNGSTTIGPFGSDLVATDYRLEGVPVVFVRDIKESGFQWNSDTYISERKAQQLNAHSVKSGEVLATKMGLPPCISCVYPAWMSNGVVTADMVRLSPDRKKVDALWLATAINHDRVKRQVAAITAGVTRPKITLADFRAIKIAKPELDEQKRMSLRFTALQEKLDKELTQVEKLKKQKLGLMHDLLTGKVPVKIDVPETADT